MPKGLYKTENLSDFKPARFTSEGTVTLRSGTIPYRTVCEDNVFYNKEGKAIASIISGLTSRTPLTGLCCSASTAAPDPLL